MIGQGSFFDPSEIKAGSNETTLRKMRPEDLPKVLAIEAVSSSTPWSEQMFLDEISHPFSSCYVLEESSSPGEVLGYICFRILGKESEVLNLSVSPSFRRCGLGRKLMEFYLGYSVAQGVERSYLEVCSSNEGALQLYRSLSYEVTGRRKGFYLGRFDAFTMVKKLCKTGDIFERMG
jgi:ribosomal-protein-alanine N-acetyltransferase